MHGTSNVKGWLFVVTACTALSLVRWHSTATSSSTLISTTVVLNEQWQRMQLQRAQNVSTFTGSSWRTIYIYIRAHTNTYAHTHTYDITRFTELYIQWQNSPQTHTHTHTPMTSHALQNYIYSDKRAHSAPKLFKFHNSTAKHQF